MGYPGRLLVGALALAASGCFFPEVGPVQREERHFAAGAQSAEVLLEMHCGELELRGGGSGLADARFEYNVAAWRPESRYSELAGHGRLEIRQPGRRGSGPGVRNRWEIALGGAYPFDLHVSLGAGEVFLQLGGLPIRRLSLDAGTGRTDVDLSGPWSNDLEAHLDAGIGQLIVRVPRDLRVRVDANRGIGELRAHGFIRSAGAYVHGPEGAAHELHIDADLGIGSLEIELAD